MFEAHDLRVLALSGLARRTVPGGGGVSDNDAHSQSIPAGNTKNRDN